MENLDSMESSELMEFWNVHRFARYADRMSIFGCAGDGTKIAAKAAANYASNKATAIQCRARGDIQAALIYEGICDKIYATLPDFARW